MPYSAAERRLDRVWKPVGSYYITLMQNVKGWGSGVQQRKNAAADLLLLSNSNYKYNCNRNSTRNCNNNFNNSSIKKENRNNMPPSAAFGRYAGWLHRPLSLSFEEGAVFIV